MQKPFNIPNVSQSLRRQFEAGKITIKEAAREFHRYNLTPFVDYAYTRKKLGLSIPLPEKD